MTSLFGSKNSSRRKIDQDPEPAPKTHRGTSSPSSDIKVRLRSSFNSFSSICDIQPVHFSGFALSSNDLSLQACYQQKMKPPTVRIDREISSSPICTSSTRPLVVKFVPTIALGEESLKARADLIGHRTGTPAIRLVVVCSSRGFPRVARLLLRELRRSLFTSLISSSVEQRSIDLVPVGMNFST